MDKPSKTCSFDGCERPLKSRGWCMAHYRQWRIGGDLRPLFADRASQDTPLMERVMQRVTAVGICWNWNGAVNQNGHARMRWMGKTYYVHRLVWEAKNGPIPQGMVIDHKCRNRRCVNVDHLQVVTQKQNGENVGISKANTSGVRGVTWNAAVQKWQAQVMHHRKRYGAGLHDSLAEAERAVVAKRLELFTNNLADLNA